MFVLASFALRLTFGIVSAVGFAVSALLLALAYALDRLYSVAALPWAFATLALPACGLVVLAFSTRLATFIAGDTPVSHAFRSAFMRDRLPQTPPNQAL